MVQLVHALQELQDCTDVTQYKLAMRNLLDARSSHFDTRRRELRRSGVKTTKGRSIDFGVLTGEARWTFFFQLWLLSEKLQNSNWNQYTK